MWHAKASICQNGHLITSRITSDNYESFPEHEKFCGRCGETVVYACPVCQEKIQGQEMGVPRDLWTYTVPNFCVKCSTPYVWTERIKKAAHELALEFDELDELDRAKLDEVIDTLTRESPATSLAATRFHKLMAKAGGSALPMFRALLVDIVSDTAKKLITGP